jgi:hypothetical protein
MSAFALYPDEREDTATRSISESDKATDTNVPATNTHDDVAENGNGDEGGREDHGSTLQDLEDSDSRQRAAAEISSIPNAIEQAHDEPQVQGSKNSSASRADPPPTPTTLEPQAGTLDAPSITSRPQAGTPDAPSTIPGPQVGAPNPLAKVRIFLELQRPTGPPKNCWSIPVEEMDIFTGERVLKRLLRFKVLKDNEKILLVHIRPENGGRSAHDVGVETRFMMLGDSREQPDWEEMLEGLKVFCLSQPTALDLKLRAILEVEAEEVQSAVGHE